MADIQTEMNGRQRPAGPVGGFASGAANVLGDILELAELQAKLAKADASQALGRAIMPGLLLVIGGCAAVAALPVLTLGLATLMDEATPLNAWQSQLLAGALVGTVAVLIVYYALRRLRRAGLQFQRSLRELANNVAWAKAAVRSQHSSGHQPDAQYEEEAWRG